MGVLGWDTIAENKMLLGEATHHAYSSGFFEGDNDWSITIKPAPGFEYLAAGNANGSVECEIRTPIDDESSEKAQFGELMHKTVTAVGTWVKDISHDNKKELHPLMLLLWDMGYKGQFLKRSKVMVFSDHSPYMLIPPRPKPPHAGGSTNANFDLAFPPAPHDDVAPIYNIVSERNMTDSRTFSISGSAGRFLLHGNIQSGHGSGKGYYRGYVDLDYDTSQQPSYIGLLEQSQTSIRGLCNADPGSFSKFLKTQFAGNIPLKRMRTHVINGQRVWSGVCESTSAAFAYVQWYMTRDQFFAKYKELHGTMNLIDVETHVDQGTRHWSAVWQAGTENEGFALGDRNYIIALAARWGMQPVNLKTFVESGQRYWFGVYRDTGIERETRYDLTWSGVRAAFHEPGRRILHLEPYMDFSARRWAAIIEHRKNDAVLTWWPNAWQFTKEVQRMMDQYGYRPYDFAVCRGWD